MMLDAQRAALEAMINLVQGRMGGSAPPKEN
jgi:hypothetical protein